jgi:RND superfamily putative drug exporter
MATLLYKIGRFAARRHVLVVIGWIVLLGLTIGGAQLLGGTLASSFEIPGTQSQNALDMLQQRFPQASGAAPKVIYVAPAGQNVSAFESQIDASTTALTKLDHVTGVTGPFASGAGAQIASDGSMAYATVQYDVPNTSLTPDNTNAIYAAGDVAATDGLTVGFAGVTDLPEPGVDYTEAIGLVVAFVVLIITFGSLLAAGMPLITALVGVGISSLLITIASGFVDISSTAPLLATMLGLAVGIDYALFIVSRHRTQLIHGMDPKESVALAVSTAGSAVVFAGLTVIIALLGLAVVQIPFLTVMGIGAALSVVVAVIVAVTLLPAILGWLGKRLVPKPTSRAARRELAMQDAHKGHVKHRTLGARWVTLVTAKPIVTVIVVGLGLLVVAIPATQLRLTLPDAGYNPPDSVSREGYDLLTEGFGPGFNGPLLITADISKTLDIQGALTALEKQFTGLPDVASVSQAIPNQTADMAIVSIIPESSPDSPLTQQLVQTIRQEAPAFEQANGFVYQVTGQTALGIDVSQRLADALLPFALVVVGLCIVLLTIVFRSLAVPITATIGYLLSVVASFGIVTAIFEWGWFSGFFTVAKVGPVISFMPILVMAVLFGLAMDYEVFLVSRMREEFVATGDSKIAVRHGFIGAARVVTAAACIMFAVFASFVPGGNAILQPIALALAAGVFIDAFLIRMTFIPALMILLGRHAWALPRALDRALPNVDLEGEGVRDMLDATAWRPVDQDDRVYAIAAGSAVVDAAVAAPFDLLVERGDLLVVTGAESTHPDAVVAAITGRQRVEAGHLRVLDHALPYEGAAVRRGTLLITRAVVDDDAVPLSVPAGRVEDGLRAAIGAELEEAWGARAADDWMRQLATAATSRAQLVAIDGTGIPTAFLQHALSVVDREMPLDTTVVVAHHGARLSAGARPIVQCALRPAPAGPPPTFSFETGAGPKHAPGLSSSGGASAPEEPDAPHGPPDPSDPNPKEEVPA